MSSILKRIFGFRPSECPNCHEPLQPATEIRVQCACSRLFSAMQNRNYFTAMKFQSLGGRIKPVDYDKFSKLALKLLNPSLKTPVPIKSDSFRQSLSGLWNYEEFCAAIMEQDLALLMAFFIFGKPPSSKEITPLRQRFLNEARTSNCPGLKLTSDERNKIESGLNLVEALARLHELPSFTDDEINYAMDLLKLSIYSIISSPSQQESSLNQYMICALILFDIMKSQSVAISHFMKDLSPDILNYAVTVARKCNTLDHLAATLIDETIKQKGNTQTLIDQLKPYLSKEDKTAIEKNLGSHSATPRVQATLLQLLGKTPKEITRFFTKSEMDSEDPNAETMAPRF